MQPGEVVAGAGALEDARTRGAHPGWPPAPPHNNADGALSTYTPEQQRTSVGAAARVRSREEWGSIASCSPARRHQATHVQAHAGAAGHARGGSRRREQCAQRATQHARMSSRALTQRSMNARVQGGDASWRVKYMWALATSQIL